MLNLYPCSEPFGDLYNKLVYRSRAIVQHASTSNVVIQYIRPRLLQMSAQALQH